MKIGFSMGAGRLAADQITALARFQEVDHVFSSNAFQHIHELPESLEELLDWLDTA